MRSSSSALQIKKDSLDMLNERIHNPITGETLYVLESNDEVFRFEFEIEPGGRSRQNIFTPGRNSRST